MQRNLFLLLIQFVCLTGFNQHMEIIDLNGTWEFEQTLDAFPPENFTRTIPVPGLITLANPKINQYDRLFTVTTKPSREFFDSGPSEYMIEQSTPEKYEPRYNWYRKTITIPLELEGKEIVLTLKKSKYVTQAFVNGIDMGSSMACYTPIDFRITGAIRFGQKNEILIRVGDYFWLPPDAPGSTDGDKTNFIPGIWDDVMLSVTEKIRIHRCLVLPDIKNERTKVKLQIQSFNPSQLTSIGPKYDNCTMDIEIRESASGKPVSQLEDISFKAKRNSRILFEQEVPIPNPHLWTSEDPFLYEIIITIRDGEKISDVYRDRFGMREFVRNGRFFALNGKRTYLRGSNVTLHRFFEDPDCQSLPWDSSWVRKLLVHYPEQLHWNAMRVCVGIAPELWYDIADEHGLLLQNEWLFFHEHGWDEQIRKEFTDWVWSDGNHPSIVIWDAINENKIPYIGNELIPELKELDPTRIWDDGWLTDNDIANNEMDEPHPYRASSWRTNVEEYNDQNPFSLGDLQYQTDISHSINIHSGAAQLVNEYAWVWLRRDGNPATETHEHYRYYLGDDATAGDRRELQAYWTQLETESFRVERMIAGVLSFNYLTSNYGGYGAAGDWFINDIKDLEPGPALHWQSHCFAPVATFIDLVDRRYTKHTYPLEPGSTLGFNLIGVNDTEYNLEARTELKLFDAAGKLISSQELRTPIIRYGKKYVPVEITLPREPGGYTLVSECYHESNNIQPVVSRRYLKVGKSNRYSYYEYPVPLLKK